MSIAPAAAALSFERLVTTIGQAHARLAAQASRAVNSRLTLRNWLIGLYITEYEQQGSDRAHYGDTLIERLSERLMVAGVSRAEARELRRYRQFYLSYPQIRETLTPELGVALLPQTNFANNRESPTPNWGVAAGDVAKNLAALPERHSLQDELATCLERVAEIQGGLREEFDATQEDVRLAQRPCELCRKYSG